MKHIIAIIASFLLYSSIAFADVITGSFENGLTGWNASLDYYLHDLNGNFHHDLFPEKEIWLYTSYPPASVSGQKMLLENTQDSQDLYLNAVDIPAAPWIYRSRSVPQDGLYNLLLSVKGDDHMPNGADFDDIEYHSVPENSAGILIGIGFVLLMIGRRIVQARPKT